MRKLVVVLAALGLVLALGTPAEAARAVRVTISLSSSSIMVGQQVTISGSVTPATGGRKVTLYQRLSGKKWTREASSRVRPDGTFRFTDKPTKRAARQYRVVVAKGGKYRAGKSRAVRLKVTKARKTTPRVSVSTVSTRTLEAGQPVTVTGRVTRTMAGRYAQLQVGPGGAWGRVGAARIASDGTFSITAAITQSGASVPLRVMVPESKFNRAVAADAGAIKVYGWHYLRDLERVSSSRFGPVSGQLLGNAYPRSVGNTSNFWWDADPWAEWGLNYRCTTLTATIGLDDGSPSGSQVQFVAARDAATTPLGTMVNGTSKDVTLDLTGGYRLKLQDVYVAGPTGSGPATIVGLWGDAKIRCAF